VTVIVLTLGSSAGLALEEPEDFRRFHVRVEGQRGSGPDRGGLHGYAAGRGWYDEAAGTIQADCELG
jgi:hypothetical protein